MGAGSTRRHRNSRIRGVQTAAGNGGTIGNEIGATVFGRNHSVLSPGRSGRRLPWQNSARRRDERFMGVFEL